MRKVVITVVGKDKVGIMARVCTYLAEKNINIVSGYFNMMMIADMGDEQKDFEKVKTDLDEMGQSIGVQIRLQSEEIFQMMHRI